jgi:hypothetical protein
VDRHSDTTLQGSSDRRTHTHVHMHTHLHVYLHIGLSIPRHTHIHLQPHSHICQRTCGYSGINYTYTYTGIHLHVYDTCAHPCTSAHMLDTSVQPHGLTHPEHTAARTESYIHMHAMHTFAQARAPKDAELEASPHTQLSTQRCLHTQTRPGKSTCILTHF